MQEIVRAARTDEVPVLDLATLNSGGDLAPLAKQLRHACETIGFFYVTNHGIAAATCDGVFAATRRYFDLPHAQRLTHRMDERFRRGFMPQGINQHPGYAPDLKESYEIGIDLPLTDPDVVAGLPLYGPNRWPDECPWLREAAESLFHGNDCAGQAPAARVRGEPRHAARLFPAVLQQAHGADAAVPLPAAAFADR